MFKRKIKTELEVFSEQRYKDAAVVIYHKLKKRNHDLVNNEALQTPPIHGWTDNTDTASPVNDDTPQNSKEIVEYVPGHVQSKFCTLM